MARVDITITLQEGHKSGGVMTFAPGELLRGTVTLYPDSDVNCRKAEVHLGWHTEGRGTMFAQKVAAQELFKGNLQAGRPVSYPFEFTLPQEPWSYDGHYINIVWDVTVLVDVPWAKDLQQKQLFVLRPSPQSLAQLTW